MLLPISFGIGEEHSLDIAYRDPGGQYSAWNNDNYRRQDLKYLPHFFKEDKFKVNIRLRGDGVDEQYAFRFEITDKGFEIIKTEDSD